MADWKKCVNEDCQYFRENGKCHEVCKDSKIKKIITNADRIRAMSDEELAEFLPVVFDMMCQPNDECINIVCNHGECTRTKECALKWLQSEAE